MSQWPGKWHSKVPERDDGLTNDHGTLYLTDDDGAWLWYDSDGHDPRTEVRR